MKRLAILVISLALAVGAILGIFRVNSLAAHQTRANKTQISSPPGPSTNRIHPTLLRLLGENPSSEMLPIIVEWRRDPGLLSETLAPLGGLDQQYKREILVRRLQAETGRQAGPLLSKLKEASRRGQAVNVRAFWISPLVALNASPSLVRSLAARSDVFQIRLDEKFYLQDPDLQQVQLETSGYPFNLDMIQVDQAQQAFGLDGTGVVVANLDTGVDWQHPALLQKYRGYNPHGPSIHVGNWYVATNEPYEYPGDGYGHGTHTMGTIVGDDGQGNRIGVAPGAKWIAVKVFTNQGYTYESWVHDAFQWLMAPNGNPALAPDVVNNSWGSNIGSDTRYRADVAALRAAGILPVFSSGNNGPYAGTVGSPASFPESFAVGAVDEYKVVASFSSRGPSSWSEIKPEVAAPGVDVRSSFPGGGYALGDGTSMAAPHITGLVALLLQANPNLTPDQLEEIIKSSATPLGSPVPNNDTGWGLVNAYAAGLQVTESGELIGSVYNQYGGAISYPTLSALPRDGGGYTQTVTVTGEISGTFSMALAPGLYDITASAFGFSPGTQNSVNVLTATQTQLTFTLSTLPTGLLTGTVSDLQSGLPLSATLVVESTPASTRTDPNSGLYNLSLPEGVWPIRIVADAHRVGHITPTITASSNQQIDISLPSAPRILLVDSGRWYYNSQISYYEDALESLNYLYTLWPIIDPYEQSGLSGGLPTTSTLSAYDLVIWSAPEDSPGVIYAADTLSYYLDSGGDLLVSGQDVAFLDAGGFGFTFPQLYMIKHASVWFENEGNLSNLTGTLSGVLEGLEIELNTNDSAGQQVHPDSVTINDNLLTQPSMRWSDGDIGGVVAGTCKPYRLAWLGFGFEGAGPRPTRLELMQRLLDWFDIPPEPFKLAASGPADTLIDLPGNSVTATFQLHNLGSLSDTIYLQVDGDWPIDLVLDDGRHFSEQITLTLESCSDMVLTAIVDIPANALRNDRSVYSLSVSSLNDPQEIATATLIAKTPAPLLLVDDERWYNHQARYTETLEHLGLPYDIVTTDGDRTPSSDILSRYPLTLWTTGYDWYSPLTSADEGRLTSYLDQGGRLLLSSQDLMDIRGLSAFIQQRLGVAQTTLSVTSTKAIPQPGNLPGIEPEIWQLVYPFRNWADAVQPTSEASPALLDENGFTTGLLRPSSNWRTAFFSFPLETLGFAPRNELLGDTLLWISSFGESRFTAPPAAAEGSRIPISLTIGLAASDFQGGISATVPLLLETSLVTDSLRGPWFYHLPSNSLVWQGVLTSGMTITLGADLDLTTGIPDGTVLPLQARFSDQHGLLVVAEEPIQVDVPWVRLDKIIKPSITTVDGSVQVTLTIASIGALSTTAWLTETLPSGLDILSGTLTSTLGSSSPNPTGFTWQAGLSPGDQAVIRYQALVNLPAPGARLVTRSNLSYLNGQRVVWTTLDVPAIFYFPFISK